MKKLVFLLLLIPINLDAKTIKVAVIDTGVDFTHSYLKKHKCKEGNANFTNEPNEDFIGHGTHISGLIVQHAKNSNYCIISIKFYSKKATAEQNTTALIRSFQHAVAMNVDIVNLSGGGPTPQIVEKMLIKQAKNILFIVAAGNNGKDISNEEDKYYPASYNLSNIKPVGSLQKGGKYIYHSSNYGDIVKTWEIGEDVFSTLPNESWGTLTGTSQATAVNTGKTVYEMYRKHN